MNLEALREQILSSELTPLKLHIPEWDVTLWVHPLSGKELADWGFEARQRGDDSDAIARQNADLITRTVRDESGALVFTSDDIDALIEKSAAPLNRILLAAQKLNAIGVEAEDAAKKKSAIRSSAA